ncbi:MAG TPA: antibiotic biosynthesis monooxygenase, partial [Blastocatellia bacterium]|nr:antibiotic biosynthesis monooxygenase [Blastocatellia bacterium]
MIQIVLKITAHPARAKDLVQALRSLTLPAQAEEGYIGYALCRMVKDDRDFLYVEEWRSIEDVERQIRSGRFSKLLEVMETSVEPPSLDFNVVS